VRRTSPATLLIAAVLGVISGWLLDEALAGSGNSVLVPPATLAVALAAIGVVLVVLALPIRRVVKGTRKEPVDPFYATRVLMLAKASAITGALLAGASGGVLLFLLSRPVSAGVGSVLPTGATIAGALLLTALALVAEAMCQLPPDDEEQEPAPSS
jgi:translation initiation factor 2 gamma subunit (eIF-2gamma)